MTISEPFPAWIKNGNFTLLNDLSDLDEETTEKAYRDARQVRFEFGEKGGL